MKIDITTWNINGIRARAESVCRWVNEVKPDVLCLQEIKASVEQIPESVLALSIDYEFFWNDSTVKKGYSGTGIWVKKKMIEAAGLVAEKSIPAFDIENRVVEVSLGSAIIIGVYIPRGEKEDHYAVKLKFLSDLSRYISERYVSPQWQASGIGKDVILCGDMNVAHKNIDVHYTKPDPSMVGLRPNERKAIDDILGIGVHDTFRHFYPDVKDVYTWWPYWKGAREKNLGWRIDCFYTSHEATKKVQDVVVHSGETSSDHAPVSLTMTLS